LVKKKIPYYIEPHGSFGKAALEKSKFKKKIANKLIFNSFIENAHGYIFLNNSEKEDSQFRTPFDIVLPNGINVNENDQKYNSDNGWFFYYIGRYDIVHKGLDYLFDALDILEKEGISIRVNLYGKGNKSEEEYVNSRLLRYKKLNVKNCGPIYGDEQSKVLKSCGIMLLTSRYEGFPMTVLEAWKYGNPCILSPGTNVVDEAVKNSVGWKTELNSEDIATSIKKAARDYMERQNEYILCCKNYVRKTYCWDKIATESYDTFRKSLAN